MASTYTSALRLTLPTTGDLFGTWGDTINAGTFSLVEQAISGRGVAVMTDADYTLTALNGASDEARNMVVRITGTLTAARNVIVPTQAKLFIFENATTGGFAVTLKTAAGSGISVPNGSSYFLRCDGTNVVNAFSGSTGSVTTVSGTAPVVSSGGATPVISMAAATTSVPGYLTAADWTTFNGKQAALVSGTNIKTLGAASLLGSGDFGTLSVLYGGTGVTTGTGSGSVVLSTSPTLTTPALGAATATSINGSTVPSSDTLVGRATTDTLTNKRVTVRVGSTASSATPTINTDNVDVYKLTAQTVDVTSFTTNLTGTPQDNDCLIIEITGTAARVIAWGTSFEASTVALPTTTVTTAMLAVAFLWNTATSKWRCVGVA